MEKLIKYILTFVLGGILVFFVLKECEEDPYIDLYNQFNKQHREIMDSLSMLKEQILLSADSVIVQNQTTNKYYNKYVYEKIDSAIYRDSTYAFRIIRFWTDSLQQLLK